MNNLQFDTYEIQQQVLDFMRALDLAPVDNSEIIIDSKIHRYKAHGDKGSETSGAYCIHDDGLPAGWVQDWRKGEPVKWHFDTKGLTQEQRNYLNDPETKKRNEAKQKQREKEQKEKFDRSAEFCRVLFEQLPPAPEDNPYLLRKKVYPYGLHVQGDTLAVPLRDIDGRMRSIQWINPDGSKKFQQDTSTAGAFWSIALDTVTNDDRNNTVTNRNNRNKNSTILVGEGFATMAKVYELTGLPCVAAMSCGTLMKTCEIIHAKFPQSQIIITADNDINNEIKHGINTGIVAAKEIVKKGIATWYVFPTFSSPDDGTDWDDFAVKFGDDLCETKLSQEVSRSFAEAKRNS